MDAPEGDTDTTEEIDAAGAIQARPPGVLFDGNDGSDGDGGDGGDEPDEGRRLEVSGTQVCASTLASVSGAAVASVFGVAGTVVGAAVMSVIATVAGAVYTHGLHHTGEKLQQSPVVRRMTAAPRTPTEGSTKGDDGPGWRERLRDRRWGVVLATAGVFMASLLAITAFELIGQRPLSGSHDRDTTSIGSLLSGSQADDEAPSETEEAPGTTLAPVDAPDDEAGSSATSEPAADDDSSPTTTEDDQPTSTSAPPTSDEEPSTSP